MLTGQGRRKMLERNGTAGFGRWFCRLGHGLPSDAQNALRQERHDSQRKEQWSGGFVLIFQIGGVPTEASGGGARLGLRFPAPSCNFRARVPGSAAPLTTIPLSRESAAHP